ncbi:NAD(P)-dependent alcohol dehydrogenase [Hyalangium versicolor]|uniref:NAD(P)-dependent alcohol dehydrogenase n=1 Tax=Hyalangium versicolor TaxID=2861190 RepID=UPI001CC96B9E|nr:NAD(P)-dependent alcohol dehydrogenase [Hyalangium versicolor]
MLKTSTYAAPAAGKPLVPFTIDRRDPGPKDVLFDVLYAGVCHSDIHQARDEWGGASFPMVPGHEIVGRVKQVGSQVTKFKVGDLAAVGCLVDSCGDCGTCRQHLEMFCEKGAAFTYNSTEMDRKTPTYGGYSTQLVVTEHFALKVPEGLDPAGTAPLLCAGITTYSPLRQYNCKKGDRVGVVGLGGLGHMAVKFAAAMGAEVTMLSTSPSKEADARRLGAQGFALTKDDATFRKLANRFDLIINTISAQHDYNKYLGMVRPLGTMVLVGAPPEPTPVGAFALINGNKRLAGSNIGGIAETQEMLDFCAKHKIVSDIEIIPIQKINEAYERMMRNDVRYRFVIDIASLKQA